MITAGGKIQRIAAREISTIGRNTQGVRIMSLDEGDTLAAWFACRLKRRTTPSQPARSRPRHRRPRSMARTKTHDNSR